MKRPVAMRSEGNTDTPTRASGPTSRLVVADTKIGRTLLLAVAVSYVIDGFLLTGFALAGTIRFAIPLSYTTIGLVECGIVFWCTAPDGNVALLRTIMSSAIQLTFVVLAPDVSFYFFTTLF